MCRKLAHSFVRAWEGRMKSNIVMIAGLLFALTLALSGDARAASDSQDDSRCSALNVLAITDTTPLAATAIHFDDSNRPTVQTASDDVGLPDYCGWRAAFCSEAPLDSAWLRPTTFRWQPRRTSRPALSWVPT